MVHVPSYRKNWERRFSVVDVGVIFLNSFSMLLSLFICDGPVARYTSLRDM